MAIDGAREGAERKKWRQYQVKVFDAVWDLIKHFLAIVKSDRINEAEKELIELEKK